MNRRTLLGAAAGLAAFSRIAIAEGAPPVGLIFVAQSTCPYCQAIAPVLYRLHAEMSLPVLVASMDARPLPPFDGFEDGRTHPLTHDAAAVPEIMIWHATHDLITHRIEGFRDMRHFVTRLGIALKEAVAL